jgi:hypothetical protein
VGHSDARGGFSLLARATGDGLHSVLVLPPAGSRLPEAQIEEVLFLDPAAPELIAMSFEWHDRSNPATLALAVRTMGGGLPTQPVRVRLEAERTAFPNVGILNVAGQPRASATGSLRVEGTTSPNGTVTFANLPRVAYRATLMPGDDPAGPAVTTTTVNLAGATGANVNQTVTLGRKVTVSGRLLPSGLAAGARLVVTDAGTDAAATSIVTLIDPAGRYSFAADSGRVFRMFVEPVPARALPRAPLGSVTVSTSDVALEDRHLPEGLEVSGRVLLSGAPVVGATIQVFCVGVGPDCVDPTSPARLGARTVGEGLSGGGGGFRFVVPDPGTGF